MAVDDELMIRQVIKRALTREGAYVTTAKDGAEGLKTFKEDPDAFDLIILDLSMPGLDGKQVMTAARALRPHCRVVLSSGYHNSKSTIMNDERCRFLPKPYTAPELTAILKEIFEAP